MNKNHEVKKLIEKYDLTEKEIRCDKMIDLSLEKYKIAEDLFTIEFNKELTREQERGLQEVMKS